MTDNNCIVLSNSCASIRLLSNTHITGLMYFVSMILILWLLLGGSYALAAYPVDFIDSSGKKILLTEKPGKVVSLSPAITEIVCRLGAGDCLAGLAINDKLPPGAGHGKIVGGYPAPSPSLIASVHPDVVLVSSIHREINNTLMGQGVRTIELESRSVADLYNSIRLLGSVFDKKAAAEDIIANLRGQLTLISRKVERIQADRRKRVIRIMDIRQDLLMIPGDDSFQNELIRAAGGRPPRFGKKGETVAITLEDWKAFDPEVIYFCGKNRKPIDKFLSGHGWEQVSAVRKGTVYSFPCDLTCRLSVRTGDFVSWLASIVYEKEFASSQNCMLEEKTIRTHSVELPLRYVRSARVNETTIFDFTNKTLIIDFKEPMRVISTLEGERKGIASVGNHYFPPPCWTIPHSQGFKEWKAHTLKAIGKSGKNSCFLFTGADMKNLSVSKAEYGDLSVFALVTAGVESNAMRMSVDEGFFYDPGTINIVLLTNGRLTRRAMTRAIITATEAKTAAMQDLDIRSSVSPVLNQATGTGTDEVLVVEGRGKLMEQTGGHGKLGELIAKSVYDGVKEAVNRQNTITNQRSVFQRLQERNISMYRILKGCICDGEESCVRKYLAQFEGIVLEPRYAAFLESALALSDANEKGLLTNMDVFLFLCKSMAEEIAGKKLDFLTDYIKAEELPVATKQALNALLNGLVWRDRQSSF